MTSDELLVTLLALDSPHDIVVRLNGKSYRIEQVTTVRETVVLDIGDNE